MKWHTVVIFLAGVLLVSFAGFSKFVKQGRMRDIDFAATVKVQDGVAKLGIQRFEGILEDVGVLAGPEFSIVAVATITVVLFIKKRRTKLFALVIPAAFVFLTFAEIYGKSVVHHPAPPFFMLKNPTTIFPTYHIWEEFSYPSGHAARAAFLAISSFSLLTSHFLRKKIRTRFVIGLLLVGYVALVSISRIYLGHHWLSDIVGGLFLGSSLASFVVAVL